jgi:hypothetical protein
MSLVVRTCVPLRMSELQSFSTSETAHSVTRRHIPVERISQLMRFIEMGASCVTWHMAGHKSLKGFFLCFFFRYPFCVFEFDTFSSVTINFWHLFTADELKSHSTCILITGINMCLVQMSRSVITTFAKVVVGSHIIITFIVHHHLSCFCKKNRENESSW